MRLRMRIAAEIGRQMAMALHDVACAFPHPLYVVDVVARKLHLRWRV